MSDAEEEAAIDALQKRVDALQKQMHDASAAEDFEEAKRLKAWALAQAATRPRSSASAGTGRES